MLAAELSAPCQYPHTESQYGVWQALGATRTGLSGMTRSGEKKSTIHKLFALFDYRDERKTFSC